MLAVTVHTGDTLSQIASEHGVSLSTLEAANPAIPDPNVIYTGEQVVIPSGGSFTQWSPSSSSRALAPSHSVLPRTSSSPGASKWSPSSHTSQPSSASSRSQVSYSAPRTSRAVQGTTSSTGGSDITSIPGVPSSFVKCVAFRESTNGTNQALNGGVYGIINASGEHVNGQSVSAQKQAFQRIYQTTGPSAWSADGCPGT